MCRFQDLAGLPTGAFRKIGLDLALFVCFRWADHFQRIQSAKKRGCRKNEPDRPWNGWDTYRKSEEMPSVNVLCSQLHTRRTHVHLDTTRAGMQEISFGGGLYISRDYVCGRNIFVLLCMTCSKTFSLFSGHFPIKCAFMRSVHPFPYIQTS